MEPEEEATPRNVRAKGVLAADSLLRLMKLMAEFGDGDLESAVVYLAIISAGAAAAMRDPMARQLYGGNKPLPDHLRRPVSRRAIADSVGLPRETVRRKIVLLVASGRVEEIAEGVRARGPVMEQANNRAFVLGVLKEFERISAAIRHFDGV